MKRVGICVVFAAVFALTALAHAQMAPRKPEPELKKLAYFEGKWTLNGDMKPGPMGPGGKTTMTEDCTWMKGGFFLLCQNEFNSGSMGSGKSTSFMGWDPNSKKYSYDDFNTMGDAMHSPGVVDGDLWTFDADMKMGEQTMKGRWTMKVTSPTSYDFKYEMSQDGTTWNTMMDGKATKNK